MVLWPQVLIKLYRVMSIEWVNWNWPVITSSNLMKINKTLFIEQIFHTVMSVMSYENIANFIQFIPIARYSRCICRWSNMIYCLFCSRVADMLEVVGERVGGWCGRDSSTSLRQAVRARRRQHNDVYTKLESEISVSWNKLNASIVNACEV